ncbi:MAG: FMN-binding domain protein [candidate division WS6 bacterium OLB20]|uniref:FMN-binding domain protein n=1 Tax=candidate division WS6 bacterium OLB20 TaxID=1617426 RepID=A0A136LXN1_9BACT|nr:MAG: FMN-binding domain protein [candidate division WS6 bacterium OLB20]
MQNNSDDMQQSTPPQPPVEPEPQADAPAAKPNLVLPVAAGGGVLILALGGLALVSNRPQNGQQVELTPTVTEALLEQVSYRDGIYYAEATFYVQPVEANETVGVTVVVSDGEIASVEIVQLEDGAIVENEYLTEFTDKLQDIVVGQSLDSIEDMELISGSTLTSDAFREAIRSVQDQAAAS